MWMALHYNTSDCNIKTSVSGFLLLALIKIWRELTHPITNAMICPQWIQFTKNDFLAFSFLPTPPTLCLRRRLFLAEKAKTTTLILRRRGQPRVFFVFSRICYASWLDFQDLKSFLSANFADSQIVLSHQPVLSLKFVWAKQALVSNLNEEGK